MKNFENPKEQTPESEKLESHIEVVKDEDGKTRHVFIVEKDKKFDLYEYLPKGVRFEDSNFMGYKFFPGDPQDKEHPPIISFPHQETNSVSGRLGILHEIGHAISEYGEARHRRPSPQYYLRLVHIIDLIVRAVRKSDEYQKLESQEERENYIAQEFERTRKSGAFPELESDDAVLESVQILAREERLAWANALRLYRQIKKEQGIDLLGKTTYKQIHEMIESDLADYQNAYGLLVPEQQVKLFLVKKYSPDSSASNSS